MLNSDIWVNTFFKNKTEKKMNNNISFVRTSQSESHECDGIEGCINPVTYESNVETDSSSIVKYKIPIYHSCTNPDCLNEIRERINNFFNDQLE